MNLLSSLIKVKYRTEIFSLEGFRKSFTKSKKKLVATLTINGLLVETVCWRTFHFCCTRCQMFVKVFFNAFKCIYICYADALGMFRPKRRLVLS